MSKQLIKSIFLILTVLICSCKNEKSPEYLLFEACINGDEITVEKLIADGINTNAQLNNRENRIFNETYAHIIKPTFFYEDIGSQHYFSVKKNRFSPLILICVNGNIEIAELLLKNNADVNYEEPGTLYHPLACAISNGFTELSKRLIENGADVNSTVMYGSTCMAIAAATNNTETVKLLLNSGINKGPVLMERPLASAIANGNVEMTGALLENGADVNEPNIHSVPLPYKGKTALVIATEKKNIEIINLLLKYNPSLDAVSDDWGTDKEYTVWDTIEQLNVQQITDIFNAYLDKNSGYKDYKFGMTVKEVQILCPDIKTHTFVRWPVPSYVVMCLYQSEIISAVPNPLSEESGTISIYESASNDLSFYFVNGKLTAVEVDFFNEDIFPELVKMHGDVTPVGGSYYHYTYKTATWSNDMTRFIVWEQEDISPIEKVYYISRSWITPLLEKTMNDFRNEKTRTQSRLD